MKVEELVVEWREVERRKWRKYLKDEEGEKEKEDERRKKEEEGGGRKEGSGRAEGKRGEGG